MTLELIKIERREYDEFGFSGLVATFGVAVEAVPALVDVFADRIDEIFVPGPYCSGEVAMNENGFAWADFGDCSATINSDHELSIYVPDTGWKFAGDEAGKLDPATDWPRLIPLARRFMEAGV